MAPSASVLSQMMQSISLTKIHEIEKQRDLYQARKQTVIASVDAHPDDVQKRLKKLLRGLEELYPEAIDDHHVKNVRFWMQQSRYDGSVPDAMLKSSEAILRAKLEVRSWRLDLAHLYSRLVTEWMDSSSSPIPMEESGKLPEDDKNSFDIVDRQKERLQELCDKFERVVFEPLETDELEIDLYLRELFDGEDAVKALNRLRKQIGDAGSNLIQATKAPFDEDVLNQCINGLLAEDLLSDEKQALLRGFLENKTVLREMVDVLNMRFADFDNWDWHAGEQGIPVLPRQQLNGKYRIWMDEDVLQAILIHYVGIRCCVDLKEALTSFVSMTGRDGVWKWQTKQELSETDELRRRYYLGRGIQESFTVDSERRSNYIKHFFLSQLPGTFDAVSANSYTNDGAPDESQGDSSPSKEDSVNIKQMLLRTLASETTLQRSLRGEVALLQSDLQWYATGLSHTTIFAVMRFFGFPDTLISFFRKVLRAPLNMNPSSETSSSPRIRQRGVPMAHAPEKLIGELILFVMDLVVNKETGMLLYRLHDDLFLCGQPAQCAAGWKAINTFAKVMGLEFNMSKTGSVYLTGDGTSPDPEVAKTLPPGIVRIGHLILDPGSGDWVVDQDQTNNHVAQLKKQLAACTSILDWVQTWNSCVSRFFSHTFGEPAFCFGREHVDSILRTYQRMQNMLFSTGASQGNVVEHLKLKIRERLGVSQVPDAFIYLPEQLGGLGLRNPFIPLLVIRDDLAKDDMTPAKRMQKYIEDEKDDYGRLKKEFDKKTLEQRLARLRDLIRNDITYENAKKAVHGGSRVTQKNDQFFSFEEYMRPCESASALLATAYHNLLSIPEATEPELDTDVRLALRRLDIGFYNPSKRSKEIKWILQMYADELRNQYGGLRLAEEKYLPLGVLAMMRRKAVRWNIVL
ncbi:hypothetical protein M426DRAFT_67458 [Hypoxylon sp. CI-4A]|nr:hypothetical protein M426DRAFT_67458 [Hypoxylon sp. CI-4A]